MEFQRERVFTSLNADELHEGDMVIVANNLRDLKEFVRGYSLPVPLDEIIGERWTGRFRVKGDGYALAYLVERKENCTNCGNKECRVPYGAYIAELHWCKEYKPKTEKHYRPFKDTDELIKVWCEKGGKWQKRELTMPLIWVRNIVSGINYLINGFAEDGVVLVNEIYGFDVLQSHYTFLDGSPCGVEE